MAWTKYQKFLALMMVVTGSVNTLCTKWADTLQSKGSDGITRTFEHPFLQAACMFLGEALCLVVFKVVQRTSGGHALVRGNQNFSPLILMPAAMFDLVGTSIMYVGLTMTYASSFQMFRGSVIVFVAMLSTIFLERTILGREWAGIGGVLVGLAVVGATDVVFEAAGEARGPNTLLTGDLLIVLAQVVTACQMVYEEKYVAGLDVPPLQAVGWEGVSGLGACCALLAALYWVPAPAHFGHNARGTVEDAVDGLVQIGNNPVLLAAILGTIVSIAFFNFAGISVTKEMSATTRMVLDSVRTLVIWCVSLAVRWQAFHWPHLLGFGLLVAGSAHYNGLLPRPARCRRAPAAAAAPHQEPESRGDDSDASDDGDDGKP